MGPPHSGPTPPWEPFPEPTPRTEGAEGKQEVDKTKPRSSWEADFTDCIATAPPGSEGF